MTKIITFHDPLVIMVAIEELGGEAHIDDIYTKSKEIVKETKIESELINRALKLGMSSEYIKKIIKV